MHPDVRERSREILRTELAEAAADYCAEHGFENVTVDEIAQNIGISRATYFRYFSSKEDAIVIAATSTKDSVQRHLLQHPPAPQTNAFAAVRNALVPTLDATRAHPERTRARIRMITGSPPLRAHLAAERAKQRDSLTAALQHAISDPQQARAVAVLATAAIELGWTLWTETPDLDPSDAFDRAFTLVAAAPDMRCDSAE